jgi:hypothetical protein
LSSPELAASTRTLCQGEIATVRVVKATARSGSGQLSPESDPASGPAPFRVVYLLLTHKDPESVEALVDRLLELSPSGQVVVHHDVAGSALPWNGHPPDRVHFSPRGHVQWGDWSMVEAMLRLVRFALDELGADWMVFMSGEDRPVVDLGAWEAEMAAARIDGIVPASALTRRLGFGPAHREENRFGARCVHRWWTVRNPRLRVGERCMGIAFRTGSWAHPLFALEFAHSRDAWAIGLRRKRGQMRDVKFYKGEQWIALGGRAARGLLDADPAITEWFKRSWIPDETYFQTILYNTPQLVLRNEPLTYVRPTPYPPYPGWMQLEAEDLDHIWRSRVVMARKIDPIDHAEVLAAIDDAVDRQRSVSSVSRETLSFGTDAARMVALGRGRASDRPVRSGGEDGPGPREAPNRFGGAEEA